MVATKGGTTTHKASTGMIASYVHARSQFALNYFYQTMLKVCLNVKIIDEQKDRYDGRYQ